MGEEIKEKEIIADLHIHSRFARATSKNIDIPNLVKYAKIKGLGLLGTGDFQHPEWIKELVDLEEREGILYYQDFPFLWQTEISLMYSQGGKGRRVHHVILAPSGEVVRQITEFLKSKGRLDYDGRPIFGFSSVELVEELEKISKDIEIIPAHVWTPWFGIFGSMSGFDSLKECFQDKTGRIHAIETGLSSDPEMNWRIKELNEKSVVSFSDAHCVHPDTLITLGDGYVLPISQIQGEDNIASVDFKDISCKNDRKIQYTKVSSPKTLKKIKYLGGEMRVSDRHRFYVFKNGEILERFAFELKEGDLLLRLAKLSHKKNKDIKLKKPKIDIYYSLSEKGLCFIKFLRKKKNLFQRQVAVELGIDRNHYWKIERGLVKIKEDFLENLSKTLNFNMGSFISNYSIKKYFDFSFPSETSVKLFELLGYLMGDGCFSIRNRGKCLLFADKNRDVLKYYKKIIESLFSCSCRVSKYSYQNSFELFIPSHVAQFFELNFSEAILKTKELKIPRLVFSSSLDKIAGFLRGFFDAEGCVGHHGVEICSSNKLLLYQVDSLLKKFDIFSSVSLDQFEKIKKKYRSRLILYGENLRKFKQNINFNHSLKKSKLQKYVKDLKVLRKSKIKRCGGFILSEIKSIEEIKSDTRYLYDLAVLKNKNYIANQVVVHNSFWPWRIGREATIFTGELTYSNILKQIRENSFKATVEVDPAYGKYHWDGHRNCNFSCSPEESKKLNNICPKCGKPLTVGVENRVEQLAAQPKGFKTPYAKTYYKLLPLQELIALAKASTLSSKKTWQTYNQLIEKFENEFNILLYVNKGELARVLPGDEQLVELIMDNREGKIRVRAGFDGQYGEALLREKQERLF